MKARIAILEKVEAERDELLERLKNTSVLTDTLGLPTATPQNR